MSRIRTAVSGLLLAFLALTRGGTSLAIAQDAGMLAVWRDGEIRTNYSPITSTTDVFVAVVPTCAHASPTLVLHATFHGREPESTPAGVEVRAAFGLRADPNVLHAPSLAFIVQTPPRPPATIDITGSLRPPLGPYAPGEAVDVMIGRLSTPDLDSIVAAKIVSVRVLGLDACALAEAELGAVRQFADDIHTRR